jgi:hypothetical protein
MDDALWKNILGSTVVTAVMVALAKILEKRVPAARKPAPVAAPPDPAASFNRVSAAQQSFIDDMVRENRQLRTDMTAQHAAHQASMLVLRAEMDRQDAECERRLRALSDRIDALMRLLAKHNIVVEVVDGTV